MKPLRTPEVGMNLDGSIQPWLVVADDGSLSDAIHIKYTQGTGTLPKPELQSEHRGLGKITAAALQIYGQEETAAPKTTSSSYLPKVLRRACRNFGRFY